MNENVLKPLAIICQSDPSSVPPEPRTGCQCCCWLQMSPLTLAQSRLTAADWRCVLSLNIPRNVLLAGGGTSYFFPFLIQKPVWSHLHLSQFHVIITSDDPRFPLCPSPQLHQSHLSPDLHHHGQLLGWAGLGWVQATSVQHVDRGLVSPVLYATDLCTSHPLTVTQERLTMHHAYTAPLPYSDHGTDKLAI